MRESAALHGGGARDLPVERHSIAAEAEPRPRPHDVGQMRSIASGLASHSPAWAHAPHDVSVSLHVCVHVPHESGQISAMYFCESHIYANQSRHKKAARARAE